jgi:SAM-dependent methyltransferase
VFDKLCSTNTLYFWKKPEDYFSEMFRVLRPGGKVVIGFRDGDQMSNLDLSDDIFNSFSKTDIVNLLSNAGFIDAQVNEKDGVPFVSLCGVATKA